MGFLGAVGAVVGAIGSAVGAMLSGDPPYVVLSEE